jgi:hypothetical protein
VKRTRDLNLPLPTLQILLLCSFPCSIDVSKASPPIKTLQEKLTRDQQIRINLRTAKEFISLVVLKNDTEERLVEMGGKGSVSFEQFGPCFFAFEGVAGGVGEGEVGGEPVGVGFLLGAAEVEGCFVIELYL